MRPQAEVHLIRPRERVDDGSRLLQQGTQFGCFLLVQLRKAEDVPPRFDDEGSNTERPDAVLNEPAVCLVDPAPGQLSAAGGEIAREAAFHRDRE